MRTRVKICCISSRTEARAAVAAGADALGLVSAMPSGPGVIAEASIAEIAAAVPPAVGTVLLTAATEPAAIVAQQRRCGVNTIQLCDALDVRVYPVLREALPGVALIQVIHVRGESAVAEAMDVALAVDGLLLDSGNPTGPVKELGGTGRVHDWALSRRIVAEAPCPVFPRRRAQPRQCGRRDRHGASLRRRSLHGRAAGRRPRPRPARRLHGRGRRGGRAARNASGVSDRRSTRRESRAGPGRAAARPARPRRRAARRVSQASGASARRLREMNKEKPPPHPGPLRPQGAERERRRLAE